MKLYMMIVSALVALGIMSGCTSTNGLNIQKGNGFTLETNEKTLKDGSKVYELNSLQTINSKLLTNCEFSSADEGSCISKPVYIASKDCNFMASATPSFEKERVTFRLSSGSCSDGEKIYEFEKLKGWVIENSVMGVNVDKVNHFGNKKTLYIEANKNVNVIIESGRLKPIRIKDLTH